MSAVEDLLAKWQGRIATARVEELDAPLGVYELTVHKVVEHRLRTAIAIDDAATEALDDRIRDVMDIFCCSPHSCDGDPELRKSCVACLYIELNKALLPGWNPP